VNLLIIIKFFLSISSDVKLFRNRAHSLDLTLHRMLNYQQDDCERNRREEEKGFFDDFFSVRIETGG
jgi:hypothetical protein